MQFTARVHVGEMWILQTACIIDVLRCGGPHMRGEIDDVFPLQVTSNSTRLCFPFNNTGNAHRCLDAH